jgi:DNA-binding winged helix-turn-helix (wHTH) protein/WD40 repeat protein
MWGRVCGIGGLGAIPARAIYFSPFNPYCCNGLGDLVPARHDAGGFTTHSRADDKLRFSRVQGGCGVELSPTQETVRFGLFELDLAAAQLTRNGTSIRLPQQPLRLLSVLLESPGEIVTREQLRQRLWPSDIFIDFDHGLNKAIQKLRDALGDSADSPRYIETVPRVGYRFIAPVRNGTSPPPLESPPLSELDRPPEADTEVLAAPQFPPPTSPAPPASTAGARTPTARRLILATALLAIGATAAVAFYLSSRTHPAVVKYTQLTDFTDSATTPALSPDGHILAFIRGGDSFMSAGEVYVKMLPDGEARPLTHDPRLKYNLAFSPDGSQIAYTVLDGSFFSTYTVSTLGGDSHLLLSNAAGLTWLDPHHLLFSRAPSGLHLGVVTATDTGDDLHELYLPPHERAMAHYSFASPDHGSALVVEMNGQGGWARCRLISLKGAAPPTPIGPKGGCTAAGWSPDGSWMYFVASLEGGSHIWRQHSPESRPEQITTGVSEENGLAVEQDGRSIITSIGTHANSLWIHDPAGDRSLSSEGEVVDGLSPPSFAPDDKTLYYLLQHQTADAHLELWRVNLDTGKSEAVFPGTSMGAYDVSPDGKQVVYASAGQNGKSQLWLAPMDRSAPARQISGSGERTPYFGPLGQILFQVSEGNVNYLEQMNQDGSGRSKVVPYPIIEIRGISPARRWLTVIAPYPDGNRMVPRVLAIPLNGGPARQLCASYCEPAWSSIGRFLLVPVESSSQTTPGRSLVLPVGPGETLPPLPPGGIQPFAEPSAVPGAQSLNRVGLIPGADLSHYAYVKTTAHRNLYRISLP